MFTKADLKTGDFVVRENGDVECVLLETNTLLTEEGGYVELSDVCDNLNDFEGDDDFNIIKVYRPHKPYHACFVYYTDGELVYERSRDDEVEMTIEEISKALSKKVKVVG